VYYSMTLVPQSRKNELIDRAVDIRTRKLSSMPDANIGMWRLGDGSVVLIKEFDYAIQLQKYLRRKSFEERQRILDQVFGVVLYLWDITGSTLKRIDANQFQIHGHTFEKPFISLNRSAEMETKSGLSMEITQSGRTPFKGADDENIDDVYADFSITDIVERFVAGLDLLDLGIVVTGIFEYFPDDKAIQLLEEIRDSKPEYADEINEALEARGGGARLATRPLAVRYVESTLESLAARLSSDHEQYDVVATVMKALKETGLKEHKRVIVNIDEARSIRIETPRGTDPKFSIRLALDDLIPNALDNSPKESKVRVGLEEDDNNVSISVTNDGEYDLKILRTKIEGQEIYRDKKLEINIKYQVLFSGSYATSQTIDVSQLHKLSDTEKANIPPKEIPFIGGLSTEDSDIRGMGLYIVRHFMQKLGGDIDFESANDQTTFTVTLPKKTSRTRHAEWLKEQSTAEKRQNLNI